MDCCSAAAMVQIFAPSRSISGRRLSGITSRKLSKPRRSVSVCGESECASAANAAAVEALTLRDICHGRVPDDVLRRVEDLGFKLPTEVQRQSLPILLSGKDCILQAQTGSGKTLAYLLLIFSAINYQKPAVQALVIVPTRELGMQVASVARMLAAKPTGSESVGETCTIMTLLDGGMLKRHKTWLRDSRDPTETTDGHSCRYNGDPQSATIEEHPGSPPVENEAEGLNNTNLQDDRQPEQVENVPEIRLSDSFEPEEKFLEPTPSAEDDIGWPIVLHRGAEPPEIVVATLSSLCLMLEKNALQLDGIRVLVIDEVDFMFNLSKQAQYLRKLLTSYSTIATRQTVFASASIPQHNRFLSNCVQQKWTKKDVVHVHVNALAPLPSCLRHRYVICEKNKKLDVLHFLLQRDAPKASIIFVNDQSEKSKRAGDLPSTVKVLESLKANYSGHLEVCLLEEDMNFNARATSFSELRQGGCLLVATDIAGRGFDLPETTHIYNFDLPKKAVDYLHRAGRAGRRPFSEEICTVNSLISKEERFVLQKFENELLFDCQESTVAA